MKTFLFRQSTKAEISKFCPKYYDAVLPTELSKHWFKYFYKIDFYWQIESSLIESYFTLIKA